MFEFLKRSSQSRSGGSPAQQPAPNPLRGLSMEEQEQALDPNAANERNAPVANQRDKTKTERRQESVMDAAQKIGNQDVILEQLAHRGANKAIGQDTLRQWGYREAGAVADPESGFRAVLFLPTAEVLEGQTEAAKIARAIHGGTPPPVLAFRGTQEKRGAQDDTNREGVGAYQFQSNVGRISQMFGAAGGKCVVAGHSLGGALAQLAASRFPSSVLRIVTFQAPAVTEEAAQAVSDHNAQAAPEDQITSTHYRASGDLVHQAGEKLTDGDVYTFSSKGIGNPKDHLQFPLARLAAARGGMIPGVTEGSTRAAPDELVKVKKTDSETAKSGRFAAFAERSRKALGGAIRDTSMETYVQVWRDVEAMCRAGVFTQTYVMGVIDANKVLKPVQKDKMKQQVRILYAQLPQGANRQGGAQGAQPQQDQAPAQQEPEQRHDA